MRLSYVLIIARNLLLYLLYTHENRCRKEIILFIMFIAIRKITIYCEFLNEATVVFAIISQIVDAVKERILPLANWTPYDHSSNIMFWLSLIHQSVALLVCANASVAHETIISGLMLQICAQLEILGHRVKTLPMLLEMARKNCDNIFHWKREEKRIIRELIEYHLYIYG